MITNKKRTKKKGKTYNSVMDGYKRFCKKKGWPMPKRGGSMAPVFAHCNEE